MEGRNIVVVVDSSGPLLSFAVSNFTHFHRSRKWKKWLDVRLVLIGGTFWTGAIYGSEGWKFGKGGCDILVDYHFVDIQVLNIKSIELRFTAL